MFVQLLGFLSMEIDGLAMMVMISFLILRLHFRLYQVLDN